MTKTSTKINWIQNQGIDHQSEHFSFYFTSPYQIHDGEKFINNKTIRTKNKQKLFVYLL